MIKVSELRRQIKDAERVIRDRQRFIGALKKWIKEIQTKKKRKK